ncbi:MAG: hypothetical protein Q8R47_00250 [Nanoarchaeota archaeon]|nr:hypothetical protein [Nanoarchaeota archaeon]
MIDKKSYDSLCDKLEPYVASAFDTRTFESNTLRLLRIKVSTELIVVSWSEALRWAYKEQGEVQLCDYLLPDNLGRGRESWNSNISRFDLSQELLEDLLKKFGQKEIIDNIELPWGGYVRRVEDNFELRGPKQID